MLNRIFKPVKYLVDKIISILNNISDMGIKINLFRYFVYAQTLLKTITIIIFSIYGFERLGGFGSISTQLDFGYSISGLLLELVDLMVVLSVSCVMFVRIRESNIRF